MENHGQDRGGSPDNTLALASEGITLESVVIHPSGLVITADNTVVRQDQCWRCGAPRGLHICL